MSVKSKPGTTSQVLESKVSDTDGLVSSLTGVETMPMTLRWYALVLDSHDVVVLGRW